MAITHNHQERWLVEWSKDTLTDISHLVSEYDIEYGHSITGFNPAVKEGIIVLNNTNEEALKFIEPLTKDIRNWHHIKLQDYGTMPETFIPGGKPTGIFVELQSNVKGVLQAHFDRSTNPREIRYVYDRNRKKYKVQAWFNSRQSTLVNKVLYLVSNGKVLELSYRGVGGDSRTRQDFISEFEDEPNFFTIGSDFTYIIADPEQDHRLILRYADNKLQRIPDTTIPASQGWIDSFVGHCRYNITNYIAGTGFAELEIKGHNSSFNFTGLFLKREFQVGDGILSFLTKGIPLDYDNENPTPNDFTPMERVGTSSASSPLYLANIQFSNDWLRDHSDPNELFRDYNSRLLHRGLSPRDYPNISSQDIFDYVARNLGGYAYESKDVGVQFFVPDAYIGEWKLMHEDEMLILSSDAEHNYNMDGIINQVRSEVQGWVSLSDKKKKNFKDELPTGKFRCADGSYQPQCSGVELLEKLPDWSVTHKNEESIRLFGVRPYEDDVEYSAALLLDRDIDRRKIRPSFNNRLTSVMPNSRLVDKWAFPLRYGRLTVPLRQPTAELSDMVAKGIGAYELRLGNNITYDVKINKRVWVCHIRRYRRDNITLQEMTYLEVEDIPRQPKPTENPLFIDNRANALYVLGERVGVNG